MSESENTTNPLIPLNLSAIWTILRERGYEPKLDGDQINVDITAEGYGDLHMSMGYQYPRFDMWQLFSHRGMDLSMAQMIANKIANELVMIKVDVGTSDGNQGVNVQFHIVALCHYEAEFREAIDIYIALFEKAMTMYSEEFSAMEKSKARIKRPHIYYPVYYLLPDLFSYVSKGETPIEALMDEDWIRLTINSRLERAYSANRFSDWDSFKINRVENFGGYKLIVYQFPDPKFVPEAKYGVVMLNTTTLTIDYYTMELSFDGQWAYCSCTTERHYNYGSFDSGELDDFLKWVLEDKEQLQCSTDWKTGEIKPAEPDSGKGKYKDAEPQAQPNYDIVVDKEKKSESSQNKLRSYLKDLGTALLFVIALALNVIGIAVFFNCVEKLLGIN